LGKCIKRTVCSGQVKVSMQELGLPVVVMKCAKIPQDHDIFINRVARMNEDGSAADPSLIPHYYFLDLSVWFLRGKR